MTFAKRVPARLSAFTLLLIFIGLTSLPGFAQERADQPHIGLVQDWSHRHIVFTDTNDVQTRVKQSRDLRALSSWARRTRVHQPNTSGRARVEHRDEATNGRRRKKGGGGSGGSGGAISGLSVDWALPLGKGRGASAANYAGLAAGAYPAKYSFDIGATPDCINDYIAMGLNTPGAAGYPNIVGINNLYSNSGNTGFCSDLITPITGPTTLFAYFTASANPTSVVLSLDGKKIAWVENATTPVFHVLAWSAADNNLAAPVDLSAAGVRVVTSAPLVGSGTVTSLTLTSAVNDTNSSPYVDYTTDTAYVGSDNGRLYKVTNVFCQTIASPGANSTCATAQPALDGTWGATGVSVAATTGLTSPLVDTYLATPLVFVGGSSGTSRGSVFARNAASGVAVGAAITPGLAAAANGGIVDPPVIDVTNHKLYVTAGCDSANNTAVAVQNSYTATGFGTGAANVARNIGSNATATTCPTTNMHAGTPDNTYIASIQSGGAIAGNMIFCGTVQASVATWQAVLYKFGFTGGTMNAAPTARSGAALGDGMGVAAVAECSALTDVFNSNFASPTERIYMGLGGTTDGHLRSFDAAFTTPAATPGRGLTGNWTGLNGVVTLPIANNPITIGPGNYVVVTLTAGGTCAANANVAAPGAEVISSTTTTITYAKPTIGNPACTGTAAGTATSDGTIPGISLVDITTPLVAQTTRATSGIIIDNVAATGSFAEASNIYFTQLAAGNIAGGSCPATATITTITGGGGTKTVTTSAGHGLVAGDSITISGNATAALNGVWVVATAPTGTTFTFAGPAGSTGNGGSVFARACFYKLSQSGLQ